MVQRSLLLKICWCQRQLMPRQMSHQQYFGIRTDLRKVLENIAAYDLQLTAAVVSCMEMLVFGNGALIALKSYQALDHWSWDVHSVGTLNSTPQTSMRSRFAE